MTRTGEGYPAEGPWADDEGSAKAALFDDGDHDDWATEASDHHGTQSDHHTGEHDAGDVSTMLPGSRRDQRSARVTRRKRRRRSWVTLVVTVALLGGAVAGAWFGLKPVYDSFNAPDDYAGPGSGEVQVVVHPGDSGGVIGRMLEDAGVILSAKRFIDEAEVDARVATIQPGTYALREEMSVSGAIDVLAVPANRIVTRVTIPEGRRATQVVEILAERGGFDPAALQAAVADPAQIGLPAAANGVAEGWLFPSTYEFEPGTAPAEALATMVRRTQAELAEAGVPDDQALTVLTKASIVQVEAGKEEDFAKVARVIENRLAVGMPLQMDSTTSYATGIFDENTTAEQRASSSPYNTYRAAALPPGAISNPGRAAIDAVLAPEPGPWVFFVTVNLDTGETKFAATGEEHQRNVAEYQAWAQANR